MQKSMQFTKYTNIEAPNPVFECSQWYISSTALEMNVNYAIGWTSTVCDVFCQTHFRWTFQSWSLKPQIHGKKEEPHCHLIHA